MASTFFRSVRSLDADDSQRSYLGIALAALLLGAWMVWFFLARVSVYAVTNKADLEVGRSAYSVESAVDGRVVATHLVIDQEVKAGDVLVELDSGPQSFQLSEEKTQVAGADPQIRSREQEIASEQQALEQDQQSAKDALDEARAHYREAEAAAQFAQTESERLRKMYDAGVVAELDLNRSVADAQQRRAAADSLRYGVVRLEGEQHTRTNERKAHIDQLTSELNKLRGDQAAQAEPEQVRALDVEQVQQPGDVISQAVQAQRPAGVGRVTVTLQFDADRLAGSRQAGQQPPERQVDGGQPAVQQHQRPPGAVDLVVHPQPVDRRVPARIHRRSSASG